MKQVFRVPNMECPNCAMRLEGLEDELPGIMRVNASYRNMKMVVEFNESQVNPQQIIDAALKMGYQAIPEPGN